ncbi:Structural maintenance of chromosomes protein 4 [Basidiobolus ranarum]|uniref:Structural maintenance of chromosomes protein 4 n=1 Tax=Basidiobolus ranarum TaxID=34480 RepID=A0ABR2W0Z1_9FUNG
MNLNPIKTPENVPRLYDLVKPKDAIFAPAFYSVLRDTLVAKDLEQANRIAFGKQRWRVVTLDGQLIDKSGTMSGGGNKVHRGAMSSRFMADDVAEETVIALEKKREVKTSEYRTFIENRKELEKELEEGKKALPALELKMSKLEMDITSMTNQFAEGKKKIVELKEQVMPDEKDLQRMEKLEAEIAKYTKELESLKSKASKYEDEIKSLHEQILSVGGVRLRSQNAKVESIKEQIEITNSSIVKSEVEKKKAEKDLAKITKTLEKYESEIIEVKEDLLNLNKLIEEKSEAAMSIRARSDEAREIMEEKKAELEEMKKLLEERTAMFNESRVKEVQLRNQLEDSERSKAESIHKSKYWKAELDRLAIQEVTSDDSEQAELPTYSPEELEDIDRDSLKEEIVALETKLQEAKPNLSVLNEYREIESDFRTRVLDLEQVTQKRDDARQTYDNLRKSRLDEFMVGFNTISHKLKEMYQMITLGGNAELELVDSLDPFSEGIIFSVMPPKKTWKNISNLSGGEKTLSSLALVFALHHFKPTPLYVMDEIDAALDFRNVSIVANYIKDRTKNAQFVIISLRNNMFELADRLVGVYKTDNCTKSITINPEQMAAALT